MQSYEIPKAPQSILEIIETGWKYCRHIYQKILPFTFAYALAGVFLQLVSQPFSDKAHPVPPLITVLLLVATILIFSLSLGIQCALVCRFKTLLEDGPTDINQLIRYSARKIPSLWAVVFFYALFVLIGLVLFVIPGIYVMILLYFALFNVILKDAKAWESLRRSKELVSGHWWHTAIVLFVIFILVGLGGGVIFALVGKNIFLSTILNVLFQTFVLPIFFGIVLALFFDLEIRLLNKPIP